MESLEKRPSNSGDVDRDREPADEEDRTIRRRGQWHIGTDIVFHPT